jgi:hydroxyethylthiazole kinase-like uncharacterized protein yjeF
LLRDRWPEARRITLLCGAGNNGGDGYVLARLARADGLDVTLLQLGDVSQLGADAQGMLEAWLGMGGRLEAFRELPRRSDVIVDALLGIGLERPRSRVSGRGRWRRLTPSAPRSWPSISPPGCTPIPAGCWARPSGPRPPCPSSASSRGFSPAPVPIVAETSISTAWGCRRHLYAREILAARRLDWAKVSDQVEPRRRDAHKGDFGHVLVVGGAPGFSGAARLAGEGALRAGAGLVSVATHPAHAAHLNTGRPELMVRGIADPRELSPLLERASAVAIGPGLGREPWGVGLIERVLAAGKPLVMDADALNWLAEARLRRDDWVLTPHPGEAARLLGCSAAEVQADRFSALRHLQDLYGGTIVLKGAGTLVLGPSPRPPGVCSQGNPGMASGGSGDVLTGMIAALLGRGLDPENAAEAAVCLHAAAGDRAAAEGEQGLLATDLIAAIRPTLNATVTRP